MSDEAHNIGYGKNDPAVEHMAEVTEPELLAELKRRALTTMGIALTNHELHTLIHWVERLDHLHKLDHSLVQQRDQQMSAINISLFDSDGHSHIEIMRRISRLRTQEHLWSGER